MTATAVAIFFVFMGVLILDACESGMPQFDKRDEAVTGSQGAAHCAQKKSDPQAFAAVYVPTNHLYLGDVIVCPVARVSFPDMSVEQGIRVFLTGGMGLQGTLKSSRMSAGHFPGTGV